MESSEEDDDFSYHEGIIHQSKINSLFQSHTEKGIRKLCCELLDLKDSVENLCGNTRAKYLAFLRLTEEVVEMDHELVELRKHISSHGILIQDLVNGVFHELEDCIKTDGFEVQSDSQLCDLDDLSCSDIDTKRMFLEKIDVLLAECKLQEAMEALDMEERTSSELKSGTDASRDASAYKSAFLEMKVKLENQFVKIAEQPTLSDAELKQALNGLLKLGKGPLGHHILLKRYASRLRKKIEAFIPTCSFFPHTYPVTLSKFVFSFISLAAKESHSIFGDDPIYRNKVVQFAEEEIESFVRVMKENGESSDLVSALHAASVCVQASLSNCATLEEQGLKLSKLLMILLRPYMEEVLEMHFRRCRRALIDMAEPEDIPMLSPRFISPLTIFAPSNSESSLISTGVKFISIVKDMVEELTPMAILHFGGNVLSRIAQLFDSYVDLVTKALPSPSEDDNMTELKEVLPFKAETDSQQLALLGVAYTIVDELLPMTVSRIWTLHMGNHEVVGLPENVVPVGGSAIEFKDWRRQLQHSLDKLRDYFCRQYVLNFIYSREGKARLDARIYVEGEGDDSHWYSDPLPSLPFQALFARLQQLATVAGDVLLGKDKLQKVLLARLTETVVMWLSDEQDFWCVFEDERVPLKPFGLQQLILDMHFTVEIARFAGYPSRYVLQIASGIIARAVKTFAARGIDPQSTLPEDEWFSESAKASINKLLLGVSGSEISEPEDEHAYLHHEHIVSDSIDSISSCSSVDSFHSFVSAEMGDSNSPSHSSNDG